VRIFFYTPHGHELASAFVALAAKADGLSCRLRNDTAFTGPADIERADAVVVLPDRPRTGLIAAEYAKREIPVTTASLTETAETLLARVTNKEVHNGGIWREGREPRGRQQAGPGPVHSERSEPSLTGSDQPRQGSEPDTREGASPLAPVSDSAPSVEEVKHDTVTRRNPKGRK
jgi:hypothetical protein